MKIIQVIFFLCFGFWTNTGLAQIIQQGELLEYKELKYKPSGIQLAMEPFKLNQERPTLLVLIHGISPNQNGGNGKKQGVGTIVHPQFYWGYDFIRLLMGKNKNSNLYFDVPYNQTRAVPKKFSAAEWNNHHTKAFPFGAFEKYAMVLDDKDPSSPKVMVTFRDGGDFVKNQYAATIDQIYDSYIYYFGKLPFEQQPNLAIVAHSFGGIVSRVILSPSVIDGPFGDQLSPKQKYKAQFIRDRTLWLSTLSTPHQGSPLINMSNDISMSLRKLAKRIRNINPASDFSNMILKDDSYTKKLADAILKADDSLIEGNRNCIKDMRRLGDPSSSLQPEKAHRSDGSLIPVYTMTGSHPGHIFHLSKRPLWAKNQNSILDLMSMKDIGYYKVWNESTMLTLIELVGKGIIKPEVGLWPSSKGHSFGDRFKSPSYTYSLKHRNYKATTLDPFIAQVLTPGIEIENQKDGYFDSDGFVGFDSGHALSLHPNRKNHYANYNTYTVNGKKRAGSWYRIFGKRYGQAHPWDFDNHRSICFNHGTAAFIHNYIYKKAGPYAVDGLWSSWRWQASEKSLKSKQIEVKITTVKNMAESGAIDVGVGNKKKADFFPYVKIGNQAFKAGGNAIYNKDFVASGDFQKGKDYIWKVSAPRISNQTIVPVVIRIMDHDESIEGGHDVCSASKHIYQNDIVVYVDVQNGKIYGEVEGQTGKTITVSANKNSKLPVQTKFKIEVK